MKGLFRGFLSLALATAPLFLASQPAQARRVWPVLGHPGDVGATPECGAGKILVGFSGRAGLWVDQIAIACAQLQPNGMGGARLPVGEFFGGPGGAPTAASCPANTRISSAKIYLSTDLKNIHSIEMQCIDPNGNQNMVKFGSNSENYATRTHSDAVGVTLQACPQEQFVGVTVRYGKDVNGLGFTCDRR